MDGFHQSSAVRYSLGRDSADGYAGASRPSSMLLECARARGHAVNIEIAPFTEDRKKDQITRAVTLHVSQMERGTARVSLMTSCVETATRRNDRQPRAALAHLRPPPDQS
jgi:hypothetical protein